MKEMDIKNKQQRFAWTCVLILFCLFVILVISRFDFESGLWFLIVPVPVYCLFVTFRPDGAYHTVYYAVPVLPSGPFFRLQDSVLGKNIIILREGMR